MDQPMTLDEAVDKFDKLSRQIKELAEEKSLIGEFIAEQAFQQPRNSNTVRVTSRSGNKLKVQFSKETTWDVDQLMTARDLLGSAAFDGLFKTEITFTSQKRNLNSFLGTVTSDEKTETAKAIIRDAQIETDKRPYVSVEQSAGAAVAAGTQAEA